MTHATLKGLLLVTTLGTLGLLGTSTAQAATWHTGTPKAVRGTYVLPRKTPDGDSPTLLFRSATLTLQPGSVRTATRLTKVRYRQTGPTTYLLKGHYLDSGVLYVQVHYTYARSIKRLQIKQGFNQHHQLHWTSPHPIGWFYQH